MAEVMIVLSSELGESALGERMKISFRLISRRYDTTQTIRNDFPFSKHVIRPPNAVDDCKMSSSSFSNRNLSRTSFRFEHFGKRQQKGIQQPSLGETSKRLIITREEELKDFRNSIL